MNGYKTKLTHIKKNVSNIDYDRVNYEVYDDGRVFSKKSNKFLTPHYKSGYATYSLSTKLKVQKNYRAHRLVADKYVENPYPSAYFSVDHIDGDKMNNHYTNLEWVPYHRNSARAVAKQMKDNDTYSASKKIYEYIDGKLNRTFDSIRSASKIISEERGIKSESVRKALGGTKYMTINMHKKQYSQSMV